MLSGIKDRPAARAIDDAIRGRREFLTEFRVRSDTTTWRWYEGRGEAVYDGTTQELGRYLFQNHLVNLELAGVILTVSMVGAIIIARRRFQPAPSAQPP